MAIEVRQSLQSKRLRPAKHLIHAGGKAKTFLIATILLLSATTMLWSPSSVIAASPATKAMTFYLHYTSTPPQVGGVSTNYIFDTKDNFQTLKNSDFKGAGQPKITVDWFLAPSLAGPVGLNGNWQAVIFVNSTALHPATWGIEYWEKDPTGHVIWDSGSLSPTVLGGPASNNGYVDSPVYGYTLSATLNHNFSAGNTLEVEVNINAGATVPLRVWYDSSAYPSRLILPSDGYARVAGVVTQDVNGTARSTFFPFWPESQRKVVILASITDPFGGYDIGKVLVQIKGPGGFAAVNGASMVLSSGTATSYQSVFRYAYSFNDTQPEGTYHVLVSVIDNNGLIQFAKTGTYAPFIEYGTAEFAIGTQFPVVITVLDSHMKPLASAWVRFAQGGLAYVSGKTGSDGKLNLTLFTGSFDVSVNWKGVVVLRQAVRVTNATMITFVTKVYYPTFAFESLDGDRLQGILAFISYPNGTTGRLPYITNGSGSFTLAQQPYGNYSLLGLFEGVEVADTSTNVSSDGPFVLMATVYKLTVDVTDSSHAPLANSTIFVRGTNTSNSLVYRYGNTANNGAVSFELPSGKYQVTAQYYNVYWLTLAKNSTTMAVTLNSDLTLPIDMSNIPPPIWSTLGFQLVVLVVGALVVSGAFFLRSRRRRKS